jgi:hypothetical protein
MRLTSPRCVGARRDCRAIGGQAAMASSEKLFADGACQPVLVRMLL